MGRRRQPSAFVLVAPLALLSLAGAAGALLAPRLVRDMPLLLVLLTPRSSFVAAAALRVPPWILLPACVVRLSLGDPFHFVLGRRCGEGTDRPTGRWVRRPPFDQARALVRRFGLPAIGLVPTGPVMFAAGASGVATAEAHAVNLLGTAFRLVLIWWVAVQAPQLAGLAARTTAWTAPAMCMVGAALGLLAWRRGRSAAACRGRHPVMLGPGPSG